MTDSKFEVIHVVLYCFSHTGNASSLTQKWAMGLALAIVGSSSSLAVGMVWQCSYPRLLLTECYIRQCKQTLSSILKNSKENIKAVFRPC